MVKYSESKKRGCPCCDGIDPKSCMRCLGKTRLCDWVYTETGFDYFPQPKSKGTIKVKLEYVGRSKPLIYVD